MFTKKTEGSLSFVSVDLSMINNCCRYYLLLLYKYYKCRFCYLVSKGGTNSENKRTHKIYIYRQQTIPGNTKQKPTSCIIDINIGRRVETHLREKKRIMYTYSLIGEEKRRFNNTSCFFVLFFMYITKIPRACFTRRFCSLVPARC